MGQRSGPVRHYQHGLGPKGGGLVVDSIGLLGDAAVVCCTEVGLFDLWVPMGPPGTSVLPPGTSMLPPDERSGTGAWHRDPPLEFVES